MELTEAGSELELHKQLKPRPSLHVGRPLSMSLWPDFNLQKPWVEGKEGTLQSCLSPPHAHQGICAYTQAHNTTTAIAIAD